MKDVATRLREATRIRSQWAEAVGAPFPLVDEMNEFVSAGVGSSGKMSYLGAAVEYQFAAKTGETYVRIHRPSADT